MRTLVIALVLAGLAGCGGSSNSNSVVLTPELTNLAVAGAKTDLNPVFDSDVLRYSVIADELASGITITASAAESLVISVNDTLVPSDTPVSVDPANPGDIINIAVQNKQGDGRLYELLYLPPDFPELTTTVLSEDVAPGLQYVVSDVSAYGTDLTLV